MTPPSIDHRLPFGKHKGKPLADVPPDYLAWMLSACRLSSGLRSAIAAELQHRGVAVAVVTHPPRLPPCGGCGMASEFVTACWQEDRRGGKRIRAECDRCGRFLCWLPRVPPYTTAADAAASAAPILDALIQLDDLDIELCSDGNSVWFADANAARRVPPDLHAVIRQCSHQLARMLGRTP